MVLASRSPERASILNELGFTFKVVTADIDESSQPDERVSELVAALDTLSRNSELQQTQSEEFIADLKRANAALIAAFEKARKKYQLRIKKLESQLAEQHPHHQQINSETAL